MIILARYCYVNAQNHFCSMMEMYMYGKEIRRIRIANGIIKTELAKHTGLPQNTISWIELDKGIPNIWQCVLIANYFGISLDELIGRDSNESNHKN